MYIIVRKRLDLQKRQEGSQFLDLIFNLEHVRLLRILAILMCPAKHGDHSASYSIVS